MNTYLSESLILDGYRLVRFLGRGGFGEVWLCQSETIGDYRALEFIPSGNSDQLKKSIRRCFTIERLRPTGMVHAVVVAANRSVNAVVLALTDNVTARLGFLNQMAIIIGSCPARPQFGRQVSRYTSTEYGIYVEI